MRLERIQRQFLWGGSDLEKKVSSVSWATVCTEKKKGGIGIKNLSKMNKALLSKWNWRFANERYSLWRKVIGSKFGESPDGWHTRDLRGNYGTSLWKEIRKEWPSFFSKMRSFHLGMVEGSIFGKMFGVVRRPSVLDTLLFSIWSQIKRPRLRTFGIEIGGWELVSNFSKTSQ